MRWLQLLQEAFNIFQLREQFFFCLEFRGVDATAAAAQPHRMFQMQHLVVNDVIDGVLWNAGMVENAAYYDGIVRRIVVSEAVA